MTDKQIRDRIMGALSVSMMPMEMEAECVAFLDRCMDATTTVENMKKILLNAVVTGKEPCDICANAHPIPDDCDCVSDLQERMRLCWVRRRLEVDAERKGGGGTAMKRCDPNARAKCPDGKHCELYAEFADGCECDKFNEQVLSQPLTNADRIRAMSDEEMVALAEKQIGGGFDWIPCGVVCNGKCETLSTEACRSKILNWLRQPVKEGT